MRIALPARPVRARAARPLRRLHPVSQRPGAPPQGATTGQPKPAFGFVLDYCFEFLEVEAIDFWLDCFALEIGLFNWFERVVCRTRQYLNK